MTIALLVDRSLHEHFGILESYTEERLCIDQFYILLGALDNVLSKLLQDRDSDPEEGTLGSKWSRVKAAFRSKTWAAAGGQWDIDINEIIRRRNLFIHHSGQWIPDKYPQCEMALASCWGVKGQTFPSVPGESLMITEDYLLYEMDLLVRFAEDEGAPQQT